MTVTQRGRVLLAVIGTCLLTLCSCAVSATSGSGRGRRSASSAAVIWGYEQEFSSYNVNSDTGGLSANFVVLNAVLTGFWQYSPTGSIIRNTTLGTYAKTADDPLTVVYTLSPKATWSDGVRMTCDDLTLTWLGHHRTRGRPASTVSDDDSRNGYAFMTEPRCSADGRTTTITYSRPFADWQAMFGPGEILPAHVVERIGGLTSSIADFVDYPDSPALDAAMAFYESGWSLQPGQLQTSILPSSGPYRLSEWTAGQSLTLTTNPAWWGTPPKSAVVVIRYLAGTAMPQALANGEIQAMDPSPQTDVMDQLRRLGDRIVYSTPDQFTYEHLDFSVKGAFADRTVREAFARCVPRQQIVDQLVAPLNPQATVLESRFALPFQSTYPAFTDTGGRAYDTVDLAGAAKLLAGRHVTVRIGWRKDPAQLNRRRADTVALVKASCDRVGFTVVDAGSPTFLSEAWVRGDFDVALFSWSSSSLATANNDRFTSYGTDNPTGYASARIDVLIDELSTTLDTARQARILHEIDSSLWQDLATIPLFAAPGVLATSKNVAGLVYNPTQADLTWNVAEWVRAPGRS